MPTANVLASRSITPSQSINLVKNMLRAAFSSVAYIRNLFHEKHFEKSKIGDTAFYKIKDDCVGNVARYKRWLSEGVFHALAKKYLSVVRIEIYKHAGRSRPNLRNGRNNTQAAVCSSDNLLECYAFHVTYSGDEARLQLSVNHDKDVRRVSVKEGCREMLSRLIDITQAMEGLPTTHVVSVKLLFTKDTPRDYQPPLFKKAHHDVWFVGDTIDVLAGNVTTPFHSLKMQVYARSTPQHRESLLPLTQCPSGSAAKEAADVGDVQAVDEHIVLSSETQENAARAGRQTVQNDSDEDVAADMKRGVEATARANATPRVDGSETEGDRERVEDTARLSGTQREAAGCVQQDVGRASQVSACEKRSACRLPPLLGHGRRAATSVGRTQDSDFEETRVRRGDKRKASEVERYIVVRKRARATGAEGRK